jgi:hypothetical protein
MILESVVTTLNDDGTLNISPMGPTIEPAESSTVNRWDMSRFQLRPFDTSRTFANLKRTRQGVLHVTDDVLLFAQGAISKIDPVPATEPTQKIEGQAITHACRWYEFQVDFIDETGPRMSLNCQTVHTERRRDFFGFNRAMHAVIEAAILATRLDFLPAEEISTQFFRLETIVAKTAGPRETKAFELLKNHVQRET